ncbi:hypothetical protein DOY81_013590 [Sarcophaga bullata]|nr:hypothetical protein DOY81_013590 [Sarcophaga bullata]
MCTPENFHCKFTRHANYTSAVLTPILRPVNEVTTPHPPHLTQPVIGHGQTHGSTTNISQQEWELSNLKVKPDVKDMISITSNGAAAVTNSKKSLMGLASMENSLTPKVNASVQCGRFQFACHSGECIAVYNACDGIPQCEDDGSDEGPECSGANNNLNSKTNQEIITTNNVVPCHRIRMV